MTKEGIMTKRVETGKRNSVRYEFRALFNALSTFLFEADPIGINYRTNTDEYDSEVETIIPRLKEAHSEDDVRRIIHEEFCQWFAPDDVGPIEKYSGIAAKVWAEWQRYR